MCVRRGGGGGRNREGERTAGVVVVEATERKKSKEQMLLPLASASSSFTHSITVGFGREIKGQSTQWLGALTLNAASNQIIRCSSSFTYMA